MLFKVDPEFNSSVVSVEYLNDDTHQTLFFTCESAENISELFNDMVAFKKVYEDSRDADFQISITQERDHTVSISGNLANFMRFLTYTELMSDEACSILIKAQRKTLSPNFYRNINPSYGLSLFSATASSTIQNENKLPQNNSCDDNVNNDSTLEFVNPDTGKPMIVPVSEIIVGDSDYNTISKYPYVYDKKVGYLSVTYGDGIFMLRLRSEQINLIESFIKKNLEKTAEENNVTSLNNN